MNYYQRNRLKRQRKHRIATTIKYLNDLSYGIALALVALVLYAMAWVIL